MCMEFVSSKHWWARDYFAASIDAYGICAQQTLRRMVFLCSKICCTCILYAQHSLMCMGFVCSKHPWTWNFCCRKIWCTMLQNLPKKAFKLLPLQPILQNKQLGDNFSGKMFTITIGIPIETNIGIQIIHFGARKDPFPGLTPTPPPCGIRTFPQIQ